MWLLVSDVSLGSFNKSVFGNQGAVSSRSTSRVREGPFCGLETGRGSRWLSAEGRGALVSTCPSAQRHEQQLLPAAGRAACSAASGDWKHGQVR